MQDKEIAAEIKRLLAEFTGADEKKLHVLSAMIEQAAYETIYLRRLNEQAARSGLVQIHPERAELQRALPVSIEISRHAASLTNILDKLMKHLSGTVDEEDDDFDDYE